MAEEERPQVNRLKRLRLKLADRKELRDRARAKYRRTGKDGKVARRHQRAVQKLKGLIRKIKRQPRRTTRQGAEFIATFEGHCEVPVDIGDGVTSIGPGIVIHTGPPTVADRRAVWVKGQKTPGRLTRAEGITLMQTKLAKDYEPAVRALFERGGLLRGMFTPWLFDGLVSFAYNLGKYSMVEGTPGFETLHRAFRAHSLHQIAEALPLYSSPGTQFHQGLLRRRNAEARLIRTGTYSTE